LPIFLRMERLTVMIRIPNWSAPVPVDGLLHIATRARAISGELLKSASSPMRRSSVGTAPGGKMLTLQTRKTEAICNA
jgi:hypothetical protein